VVASEHRTECLSGGLRRAPQLSAQSVGRRGEQVEASDALFNIVEASLALAGFAGIVTALDQRRGGQWRRDDRDRVVNLLLATLLPFAASLLALALMYANVAAVWRVSSAALALLLLLAAVVGSVGVVRGWQDPEISIGTAYVTAVGLVVVVSISLQFANLLRLDAFWPFFAGLALSLCFGASQFARLIWFGVLNRRAAQQGVAADRLPRS
jgi:hypothetical protein